MQQAVKTPLGRYTCFAAVGVITKANEMLPEVIGTGCASA